MSELLDAARELGARFEAMRWNGGVRIVVQGAMQAAMKRGQVDMVASWRADVFFSPRQRKPSFTLVAETPEQLLRDVAALAAGELTPAR